MKRAWHVIEPGQPYIHGWHIDLIAAHLEAITDGEEVDGEAYNRLLVNVPPGTMKSLLVGVFWPAFEWGPRNKPHMRYVCASHSQNLAIRDNVRFRRLVFSDWYQERWGDRVVLTNDQNTKTKVENKATGFREAAAAGSITGSRGDRVIIDDPHSVESAGSDQMRASTIDWFLEAVPTRLNNPDTSAIVVVMQRLHEGDVSGVILDKQLGYDHIMLPMRYDSRRAAPTKLGYEDPREDDGELLFPERFPLAVVDRDEKVMGPYATAGQFQQEPAPRGGGIIKDDWWQLWTEEAYPPCDFVVASLDTAYTTKEENDFSAMTIWGVFTSDSKAMPTERAQRYSDDSPRQYTVGAPNVVMMYAWQKRLEFPDLVVEVARLCKKFAVDLLLVESKAAGISLAQELRRAVGHESFGVRLIDPKGGDKVSRLYSVQHIFSEGMVYAPDKDWAEMVIGQVRTFPKGKHDDLCFAAGTKIATKRGLISIEDVTTADYALTPIGWRRVVASGFTGMSPVVERRGLVGTFNHPVFTLDLQYQPLATISNQSKLVGLGLCDLMKTARLRKFFSKGLSIEEWAASVDIGSANPATTPEGGARKGFTSLFGSSTTGRLFRHCMTFTIETVTCLILSLRIWSAYRAACIGQWPRSTLTAIWCWLIWRKPAKRPMNGISRTRAARGIGRLVRRSLSGLGRLLRPSQKVTTGQSWAFASANGAELGLNLGTSESCFARHPASSQSRIMSSGEAESCTHITQPVYNLTVEGAHCYYANGVLVHNCDTVSQTLRFLRETGMLTRAPERIADIENSMRNYGRQNAAPLYPA